MAAKKASRADYLDSMEPAPPNTPNEPQAPNAPTPSRPEQAKRKHTLYIDPDLVARSHGAIALATYLGRDYPSSLSALVNEAIRRELVRLADDLEPPGGEFPALERGLPKGRPPKR